MACDFDRNEEGRLRGALVQSTALLRSIADIVDGLAPEIQAQIEENRRVLAFRTVTSIPLPSTTPETSPSGGTP